MYCAVSPRLFPPPIYVAGYQGVNEMEALTKRVEQLEKTTHQIQQDVAVLTARSENFATKADIECLRTEQGQMRIELLGEMSQLERRLEDKFGTRFEKIESKIDKLGDRMTWNIMLPGVLAVIAWFVKEVVLKI